MGFNARKFKVKLVRNPRIPYCRSQIKFENKFKNSRIPKLSNVPPKARSCYYQEV